MLTGRQVTASPLAVHRSACCCSVGSDETLTWSGMLLGMRAVRLGSRMVFRKNGGGGGGIMMGAPETAVSACHAA